MALTVPLFISLNYIMDTSKVSRVEIMNHNGLYRVDGGRAYSAYSKDMKVELSLQDSGQTLKVFITKKEPESVDSRVEALEKELEGVKQELAGIKSRDSVRTFTDRLVKSSHTPFANPTTWDRVIMGLTNI